MPTWSTATCSRARRCARPRSRSRPARWTSSASPRPATRRPARPSTCASSPSRSMRWSSPAGGTGRTAGLLGPRPARPGRACPRASSTPGSSLSLLLRGRVPGGTAAAAPIRYDAIRRDGPAVVYHGRVVRDGALGRPPLPVLLRDERLALHVRRRQRPRGRLGAVLRRPRGSSTTATLSRPGSAPRPTTRRATTCAGAGTTRGSRPSTGTRSSIPGAGSHADLPRARRVHHAAAVPGRAEHPRPARPPPPGVARHARPAGPGRPRREGHAGA